MSYNGSVKNAEVIENMTNVGNELLEDNRHHTT